MNIIAMSNSNKKAYSIDELCTILTGVSYEQAIVRTIHLLEDKGLLKYGWRQNGTGEEKVYYFD